MKNLFLGYTRKGEEIYTSDKAMNQHVAIIGKSGSGKSTFMQMQMIQTVKSGTPAIVINWKSAMDHSSMLESIRKEYEKYAIVIDVATEGIKIPLFEKDKLPNGEEESDNNLIFRISSLLAVAGKLTPAQKRRVSDAVTAVVDDDGTKYSFHESGIQVINEYLTNETDATSLNAASKLSGFCSTNLIVDGSFWEKEPKLYEINLYGLETETQDTIVKFLLDYVDRLASKNVFKEQGLDIWVDEAHNIDFTVNSTMDRLLNEKRKMNVNVKLASTALKTEGKNKMTAMQQAGCQFYFKPDEINLPKVIKWITANGKKNIKWTTWLKRLQISECVACGEFVVNGVERSGPIVMDTYIRDGKKFEQIINKDMESETKAKKVPIAG